MFDLYLSVCCILVGCFAFGDDVSVCVLVGCCRIVCQVYYDECLCVLCVVLLVVWLYDV